MSGSESRLVSTIETEVRAILDYQLTQVQVVSNCWLVASIPVKLQTSMKPTFHPISRKVLNALKQTLKPFGVINGRLRFCTPRCL